jgi:hypothetical protein
MAEARPINGIGALELTMRDVLGNTEELANGLVWQATGWDSVEVIPAKPVATARPRTEPPRRRPVLIHHRPQSQVA